MLHKCSVAAFRQTAAACVAAVRWAGANVSADVCRVRGSTGSLNSQVSRKAAVWVRKGDEVIFYIRAVNHGFVFFQCWFGWRCSWQPGWRGMCCGLRYGPKKKKKKNWDRGLLGHYMASGVLISTEVLSGLLHCSCKRNKGREESMEEGDGKKARVTMEGRMEGGVPESVGDSLQKITMSKNTRAYFSRRSSNCN